MPLAHRDFSSVLTKHGFAEIKKIGEGSFGKALLVQTEDGTKLVCKAVDVSSASSKETQDAVKESRLLAALKHPYIVRYRHSFIENGWLCIFMDYCEGGDLSKVIESAKRRGQRLPEDQILRWITQALLALKYIHEKHVLHRDLKSGNFFISSSGNLKMGDFGIAKVLSSTLACARTQIGTPYYLSPEVCQEKPYTWPSDIWAMGCILYELCALKVPFDAPNISALVQRICRGPTPTLPTSSDFLRQLCNAEMLQRNPGHRPSAEAILQRPPMQAMVKHMLEEAPPPRELRLSSAGAGSFKHVGLRQDAVSWIMKQRYYLSPEVCQEKPYTWPSDIWAMGCILYELCALKVPFDAPNISALVQRICRGPTPTLPTSSDFLRQLCNEMLQRNPGHRPSAEAILQRPPMQAMVKHMLEEALRLQRLRQEHQELEILLFQGRDGSGTAAQRTHEMLAPTPAPPPAPSPGGLRP
ncbi:Serine/threonine-protein kinase Nek1 [Symbiodinium microadriaticum]|uniref:non-specific serine/threonine protein kinase n=1 Tax=Symbiodinium microadriaticum TaxID=2951 RepID=A0A1Q9CSS3_SYMMI|nr:Serine/threonine-protein kinase Nek1 [Symbiodinium microadriaticum]